MARRHCGFKWSSWLRSLPHLLRRERPQTGQAAYNPQEYQEELDEHVEARGHHRQVCLPTLHSGSVTHPLVSRPSADSTMVSRTRPSPPLFPSKSLHLWFAFSAPKSYRIEFQRLSFISLLMKQLRVTYFQLRTSRCDLKIRRGYIRQHKISARDCEMGKVYIDTNLAIQYASL